MPPSISPEPAVRVSEARNGRVATVSTQQGSQLELLRSPHTALAEAYRSLAVNLQFASQDRPLRSLVVTSSAANDGKSEAAANVALAVAETGKRVILVDADLRQPLLHALFQTSNATGLANCLLEAGSLLPLQETAAPNLRLLPSGPLPSNPAEVLGSTAMERLIRSLEAEADLVIFDTAPAAGLADASMLAGYVDGVLLAVGAGRTKRDLARTAKEHLERVNARILGIVLTGTRTDSKLFSY